MRVRAKFSGKHGGIREDCRITLSGFPLHRGSVRGMVTGALLVAGFFTFPFDRMLGHWLFS